MPLGRPLADNIEMASLTDVKQKRGRFADRVALSCRSEENDVGYY
jgi:hypothetical protein